jgi:hypothetical protein
MYVIVHHQVTDQAKFWPADPSQFTMHIPPSLKLHSTLAGVDGTQAVCVWEGQSVDAVREFLDPATAGAAVNAYFAAVNKDGIAIPPARVSQPA